MPNTIEELKKKIEAIQAIEESLGEEEKKVMYSELNDLLESLNQEIENYLLKMKSISK